MKRLGIYIHIPFCKSKCNYCDFNSYAGKEDKQKDYLLALIKEIQSKSKDLKGYEIDSIYIGGGTPSNLFSGAIQTILAEIKKCYKVIEDAEVSIEANPNTITLSKALEWRSAGVNRVSVGLQTTRASALKVIGRSHTKKDYVNAIKALNEANFNNINTDLMIGLPKQKSSDVKYAVTLLAKLKCNHVSCYSLIVEDKTPLKTMIDKGLVKLPKEEKTIGMYVTACKTLEKFGYLQYEVSNFALPGFECKHNLNCWRMQEYIGFGAGAHSFVNNTRYNNVLGVETYIKNILSNTEVKENEEKQSKDDLYEETIMLGLRTNEGIDVSILDKLLGKSFNKKYTEVIKKYKKLQCIELKNGRLKVTKKGMFILNQIILDFTL